jgi:hypothetical protein
LEGSAVSWQEDASSDLRMGGNFAGTSSFALTTRKRPVFEAFSSRFANVPLGGVAVLPMRMQ